MRNSALLGFLCFFWGIICSTEGVKIIEMLRRKRQACENGTYKHGELECCLCPEGFYVKEHCTTSGTSGSCERCEKDYYRDRPNSKENCEPCTVCHEKSNRRVKKECTPNSDRVCTCLEGHYCDQGDKCTVCHRCDQCQDSTIKEACTATNNTVCKEKEGGSNVAAIVLPIVFIIVIIAAAVVTYFRKEKKHCFSEPPTETDTEVQDILQDVDLTPVLSDISKKLGWRVVKEVTQPLVTSVDIENVQGDYPKNTEEQTEQLLRIWHEKRGLSKAYSELVKNLKQKGYRVKATEVKRIVEEHLKNVE
uniref:Tumor necrosis factor receptor superfamily member 6 n=1 Tax=Astyanax mexicanus TaxID=7994 RepID=A0A8B9K4P1_ASTMX